MPVYQYFAICTTRNYVHIMEGVLCHVGWYVNIVFFKWNSVEFTREPNCRMTQQGMRKGI